MNNSTRMDQLRKLLAVEPNDAFLNFGLAMELAKCERFDESLTQFARVLELDPTYVAAHFMKAKTLLTMGEIEAARSELQAGAAQAGKVGNMHAKGEMEDLLASL